MAFADWYIEGRVFGNCNCDYCCPCQFELRPTHNNCRGFEVMEIDNGHFGEVDLKGLRTVLFYAWPGAIFEGRGEMQVVIDERANPAQRKALETVLLGGETEEAKTHWWVFRTMSDTVHPTLYKAIEFELDIEGRTAQVLISDLLRSSGRPIRNPVDGAEHRVRISIPDGIEFELAEVGNASTTANGAIPLQLSDSYGQWNILRHGPTGVVH